MKKILENLALINLNNFGKEHKLDIAGTYLSKNGRGFKWSLCNNETGRAIITITFYKNATPTYFIHN